MASFDKLIFEKLLADKNFDWNTEAKEFANFKPIVDRITNNSGITDTTRNNPVISGRITGDIMGFVDNVKEEVKKTNPFVAEEKMLQQFSQTDRPNFHHVWPPTNSFLKQNYSADLDCDFYDSEFTKSLQIEKGREGLSELRFESTKANLCDNWGRLLFERQQEYELGIIMKLGQLLINELIGRISKLKKLKGVFKEGPETKEPEYEEGKGRPGGVSEFDGTVWDMTKGNWQERDIDRAIKLASQLINDTSIQNLAEMLGRMNQPDIETETETFTDFVMKPEYKIDYAGKSDLVGVRESDDLNNMLITEKVLLSDPELQPLFLKRFVEKKLQTYEYNSKFLSYKKVEFQNTRLREKEVESGPFILCVDTSESMTWDGGLPETVAKAMSLAIFKIAVREKRKCYIIIFSTEIEVLDLGDFENSIERLIAFITFSFCGNTSPAPVLIEALKMLHTNEYRKADILMISDFRMNDLPDELIRIIERAQSNKTKLHSLVIGSAENKAVIDCFDTNWLYSGNGVKLLSKKN